MHTDTRTSYFKWKIDAKRISYLLCNNPKDKSIPEVFWLVNAIDNLRPILRIMFPKLKVDYLIWEEDSFNACVAPVSGADSFRVYTAVGCACRFLEWSRGLHAQLLPQIDDEAETAFLEMWSTPRIDAYGKATSMGADAYSVTALMSLLTHELAHVKEGQFSFGFRAKAKQQQEVALVNHAKEYSADYWSVWATADTIRPFVNIAIETAVLREHIEACERLLSTIVLAAFSCIEPLTLDEPWDVVNPTDQEDTHPQASARIYSAAVALAHWWIFRMKKEEKTAYALSMVAASRIFGIAFEWAPGERAAQQLMIYTLLMKRMEEAKPYFDATRAAYPLGFGV